MAATDGRGALWAPATQHSQPVLPTPHVSGAGLGAAMYIRLLKTTWVPFYCEFRMCLAVGMKGIIRPRLWLQRMDEVPRRRQQRHFPGLRCQLYA
jgi:hypothetical protein